MAAQAVADALGTPLLAEPAPLSALIGALRDQPLFLRSSGQVRLPLTVSVQEEGSRADSSIVELLISDGLTESFLTAIPVEGAAQTEVRQELAHYPSLRTLPEWQTATLEQDWMKQGPGWLRLRYSHDQWRPSSQLDPYFDEWTTARLGGRQDDAYVYPSIGANEQAQHPLMTWYLVMYAFSMLARYHGAAWRRLLDKDESIEAALLEHFKVQVSHTAVPAIVMTGSCLSVRLGARSRWWVPFHPVRPWCARARKSAWGWMGVAFTDWAVICCCRARG